MSGIILHHYDASPFTQKALRMLGLKGLQWRSVLTPMLPPKDDLLEMTGGYRGTPVMQIGAEVFIDTQRIAAELERRFPAPSLFPAADAGIGYMLVKWSESFFRTGLALSIELLSKDWPQPFLEDRVSLFPDVDFAATRADGAHARSQFRVHAGWLDRQLADGRAFLTGPQCGLADIQAQVFVWMVCAYVPQLAVELLAPFRHLQSWSLRVDSIGQGKRAEIGAAEALAESAGAPRPATGVVDAADPLGLQRGQRVEITPDDTRRGAVVGALEGLSWDAVSIRRHGERCGEVVVHFPRIGYRVRPL